MSHELTLEQEAKALQILHRQDEKRLFGNARISGTGPEVEETNRGPCQICGHVPEPGRKSNAWDHDHATGKFRGWLCRRCNVGLGYFKDSVDHMQKAIDYLNKSK